MCNTVFMVSFNLGLAPLCENMPSGKATKPGDVVTAKNGKTIQVQTSLNTVLKAVSRQCLKCTFISGRQH